MKKIIVLLITWPIIWLQAQEDSLSSIENENETCHSVHFDNDLNSTWQVFGIGYSTWNAKDSRESMESVEGDYHLNQYGVTSYQLGFDFKKIRIVKNHVRLITGIGIQWNFYRLANKNRLLANEGNLIQEVSDKSISKQFFKTTYVQIPLLLELNTSQLNKNNLAISAGVIGGFAIGSKYKEKYYEDGDKKRFIEKGSYPLQKINSWATARVGFGNYLIYVNYQLNPIFESGKAPQLYSLSTGVAMKF